VLAAWNGGVGGLVCLSVRSGFNLVLASLAFEPGDEVVASAITHPDMRASPKRTGCASSRSMSILTLWRLASTR
jgi:hypothetical protein